MNSLKQIEEYRAWRKESKMNDSKEIKMPCFNSPFYSQRPESLKGFINYLKTNKKTY